MAYTVKELKDILKMYKDDVVTNVVEWDFDQEDGEVVIITNRKYISRIGWSS